MNHVKKSPFSPFFSVLLASALVLSVFGILPVKQVDAVLPVLQQNNIQSELHRPAALATFDQCEAATVTGFYESLSEVDNRYIWIFCDEAGPVTRTWFLFDSDYTLLDSCIADSDRGNDRVCPSPPQGHIYPGNDFTMLMMDAGCEVQRVSFNSTNDIYVTDSFSVGSCGTSQLTYDQAGFYWHTSTSDDKVRMFNLFGMFVKMVSPSLDDGGAMDCDSPVGAAADFDAFKVYIVCDNSDGFTYLLSADFDYVAPNHVWGGKVERLSVSPDNVCSAEQVTVQEIAIKNEVLIWGCDATGDIIRVSHDNDGTGLTLEDNLVVGTTGSHGLCEPYSTNFLICGVATDGAYQFWVYNGTSTPFQVSTVNCTGCEVGEQGFNGYNWGSTWIMPVFDNANGAGWLVVEGVAEAFPYTPLPPEDEDESCVIEQDRDCDEIVDSDDPDCDGDGVANAVDLDDGVDCTDDDTFIPAPGVGGDTYETGSIPEDMISALTANGGFSRETAGLLWTVMIHAGMFALMIVAQAKISPGAGMNASVIFIFFILASALSLSMGFMPLIFFLGEMAVLGLGLALTGSKMISGGGGAV